MARLNMGPQGTRPQARNASNNKEETVVTKAGKSLQAQKSNDLGNEANYDFDAEADVSSGEDELAPKAVSDGSLKAASSKKRARGDSMDKDILKQLPEDLHSQPALKNRKNLTGVALSSKTSGKQKAPKAPKGYINVSDDSDGDLSAADGSGKIYLKTRSKTDQVNGKPKGVPVHLQWEKDPGTDSDPDIIAPGWNMPQTGSRKKARKDESDSADEPAPKKSTNVRVRGTKRG